MSAAMLGEDERAFFSAVAGLLPALFLAAILQREGTRDREGTQDRDRTPQSKLSERWERSKLAALGFYAVIFLMLAGELAAFSCIADEPRSAIGLHVCRDCDRPAGRRRCRTHH